MAPAPSSIDIIEIIHTNQIANAEFMKFETRVVLHSWHKIKKRLLKRIDSWHFVVQELRDYQPSSPQASPFKVLSTKDITLLVVISDAIAALEKFDEKSVSSHTHLVSTLNELHDTCHPLLEAWERSPTDLLTILGICSIIGRFDVARWIAKIVSVSTHFLCVCRVIGSHRLATFVATAPIVATIPGVQKAFDFDVTLADVESVAEETGWEPKESPSRADISDKDDNFSFKDIVLSSFHQELDRYLPPSAGSVNESDTVHRHYEGYVHCEVALLAHLHGRSAGTYIGVSKLSCSMCHRYFAAYREATGTEMKTCGSHGQLGQWFLPSLSIDDDDQRIRNLMAANLLKTITDHLCQLETDPMVITRFRNRHQLLSQSSVGSKDSDKVSFRTDTQGLRGVSSAVLLGDEGPTSELKKRLLAQDVS